MFLNYLFLVSKQAVATDSKESIWKNVLILDMLEHQTPLNIDGKWQSYCDNLAIFFLVMSCSLKQNVQFLFVFEEKNGNSSLNTYNILKTSS